MPHTEQTQVILPFLTPFPHGPPHLLTQLWKNLSVFVSDYRVRRQQAIPEQSTQVGREQAEREQHCRRTQVLAAEHRQMLKSLGRVCYATPLPPLVGSASALQPVPPSPPVLLS